jgi:hypothetical protein
MHRYSVVSTDHPCAPVAFISNDALPAMYLVQRHALKEADVFQDGTYLLSLCLSDGGMWRISRHHAKAPARRFRLSGRTALVGD